MCRRLWNACWRWAVRRENVLWLSACCSGIVLGIFCCAADQPSGPLGNATIRFLAAVLAHWVSLAHPELYGWIVETGARSALAIIIRLLRLLGLF